MDTKNLLKNKWGWIIGGVVSFVIVVMLTGEDRKSVSEISQLPISQDQPQIETHLPSDKIKTLSDFDYSQFCKDYNCKKTDSWALNSGGVNNTYDIQDTNARDKYDYIGIEITTENNLTMNFGLMYFGREDSKLTQNDLQIAYKLFESIDSTQNTNLVKNYVAQNIEKNISQINKAKPIIWGLFNVYAGKIGQQTLSIEKTK